jgi:predicted phosphodiesterase
VVMRVAVVSDVHANVPAMRTVLDDIRSHDVDEIWCLGDLTGRGGRPAECVSLAASRCDWVLAGNHDLAVDGRLGYFFGHGQVNDPVALSQQLHQLLLDPAQISWMRTLRPYGSRHGIDAWHGSVRDPIWEFVSSRYIAISCLALQRAPIGLVGHSHEPYVVRDDGRATKDIRPQHDQTFRLDGYRALLNPGARTWCA